MVLEGKIRFEVEDPPGKFQTFEAAKGDLVLAPERHLFSLEVIGSEPAIRLAVTLPDTSDHLRNQAGARREGHGIYSGNALYRQQP